MYAYEIFEEVKSEAEKQFRQKGNAFVKECADNFLYQLLNKEQLEEDEAIDVLLGAFSSAACNNGKITNLDYYTMLKVMDARESEFTYDSFFDMMSKYNKQAMRNSTVGHFQIFCYRDTALAFIYYSISVAMIDGDVKERNESYITSLCEVARNRFDH